MKKILVFFSLCVFMACSPKKDAEPQTAMDAGRAFIRASLDGDFKAAEPLLLKDAENEQLFESYKRSYSHLEDAKKQEYKAASYNINKFEDLNDSTTIVNYSNSYMNKPMEIKLVRTGGKWMVDFKYTFAGNLPID
ncbi:MAG: hypothetical protein QM687_15205 [Ferruginibacter sp.]